MKLKELVRKARRRAQDLAEPGLWTPTEWAEYATDAEIDACRRARLIVDTKTEDICTIAVAAGEPMYELDQRIIRITRVSLASRNDPLRKIRLDELDACYSGWRTATGYVERFCLEDTQDWIRFVRIPEVADTATLSVIRTPLKPLVSENDEPEINARWHEALVYGMLARAYLKDDTETLSPQKADVFEALFTREFGPRPSAVDEQWTTMRHGFDDNEGL